MPPCSSFTSTGRARGSPHHLTYRRITGAHLRSRPPAEQEGSRSVRAARTGQACACSGPGVTGQAKGTERPATRTRTRRRKAVMPRAAREEGTGPQGRAALSACGPCFLFPFPLALLPELSEGRIKSYLLEQVRLGRKSKCFFPPL